MNHTEFILSRFENRNGVISWRVGGFLHGIRIRKNFKTREEAAAEKATLEIKALHASSGLRSIATALKEEQVREAEALFQRVEGKSRPLSFYVDFALANFREPERQKPLADAISDYVAAKEHEFSQKQISLPQLRRIKSDLKRLGEHVSGKSVAEVSVSALIAYLEQRRLSLKTFNNQRGVLGTFFKYAFHRGWVAENPVVKVPHYRIRHRLGAARTLNAVQAAKLMEYCETFEGGRWVPYFALCLFAGIRPSVPDGEIARLKPEDVCLDAGIIHIPAEVSKVREPRKVTIQPNLAAWLRAYPLDEIPILVGVNFHRRRQRFNNRIPLTHDVLRHTFISMFVAKFRSMGEAALQAGNSEGIIRKHYLDLKSPAEAEQFFSIMPKRIPAKTEPGNDVAPPDLVPFVAA